ncbi:MAG: leucine-rich repeat protein [Eubacterium sp.]|nr:leucine-rich repeat protein [Eubacterium sp.]
MGLNEKAIKGFTRFLVAGLTMAIMLLGLLPGRTSGLSEVRADDDWELDFIGDDDVSFEVYMNSSYQCKAIIPSDTAMKEWLGTGSTGQSVEAMYGSLPFVSIEIGKDVTKLDGRAFSKLSRLDTLIIDEGNTRFIQSDGFVTSASGKTLYAVLPSKLSESSDVTLPESVTIIGSYAFGGNTKIGKVTTQKVTAIDDWAFDSSSVTEFACDNLTSIGYNAFQNCSKLTALTITEDDGVALGSAAFLNCTSLQAFPYTITSMDYSTFENCSSFTSFTLPDNLKSIPSHLFSKCSGLTEMNIPETVTSIGESAFENCTGLTTITFNSATPPTLGNYAFPKSVKIIVPAGTEGVYVDAFGDDYYDNIYETGVTKYPVCVGNVQFKSNLLSAEIGGGTATYDPATKTLTLDSVNINEGTIIKDHGWGRYGGCIFTELPELTIVVKGNNSIVADIDAIYTAVGTNVTIKGSGKLTINTYSDSDPWVASMYIGLGDNPTGVDSGDLTIDGTEIIAKKEIIANRNIIIKGGATVNCSGRLRSNNNGSITITEDSSVAVACVDMGLPSVMFQDDIYSRDMFLTLDGGDLTITDKNLGIYFEEMDSSYSTIEDPRGHIVLKEGTLTIENTPEEGKVVTNCPKDNITIAENFVKSDDKQVFTADMLMAGGFTATTETVKKYKITIDMGGHGDDIIFKVPEGTVLTHAIINARDDVKAIPATDNGYTFADVMPKSLSEYTGYNDFDDSKIKTEVDGEQVWIGWSVTVNEPTTLYACWFKNITEFSAEFTAPQCGTAVTYSNNLSTPALSLKLPENSNYVLDETIGYYATKNGETISHFKGEIEGGNQYSAVFVIISKFGYVFSKDAAFTLNSDAKSYGATISDEYITEKLRWNLVAIATCDFEVSHKYGAWTKLDDTYHQRVCVGDDKHIEKKEHSWDAGKVTKEATVSEAGVKTFTCRDCGATKTEAIPKKDDTKPADPSNPENPQNPDNPSDGGKETNAGAGVGNISADGKTLTDTDKQKWQIISTVTQKDLKKNLAVADKKTGGKYKITKVTKKGGKVTGGNVTYMKPYNKNCTKMTATRTIKIGGVVFKVTAINKDAFKGCKKLKTAAIDANVLSIGANAYSGCTALTTVTIRGNGLTNIGANAFNGCKRLKTITIKSTNIKKIGAKAFKGISSKATFKLPKKKKTVYEKKLKKAGAPKSAKFK